jgi:urease accessory protein
VNCALDADRHAFLPDSSRAARRHHRWVGDAMTASVATDVVHGWQGRLALGFEARGAHTVLAHRRRHGPLAVQRPFYPEGAVCHVYLLHPPGGVVGGDRLELDVECTIGSQALLTTPGATKFYRSSGALATQVQRLVAGADASLEWLPQENILFPGARVRLETRVELQHDARLALWEIHCLGRPTNDEPFDSGMLDSTLSIYRDGRPQLLDRLRVNKDNRHVRSILAGLPVTGTLVISHASDAECQAARALLTTGSEHRTAATLIDDLLVVRYLGASTERARAIFTAVWSAVRQTTLGRPSHMPRIWAT